MDTIIVFDGQSYRMASRDGARLSNGVVHPLYRINDGRAMPTASENEEIIEETNNTTEKI